jgi:hypothetical protein
MERKQKVFFAVIKVLTGITLIILGVRLLPGMELWVKFIISFLLVILLIINSFHGISIRYNSVFGITFGIISGLIVWSCGSWFWGLISGIIFTLIFSYNRLSEKVADFREMARYRWSKTKETLFY